MFNKSIRLKYLCSITSFCSNLLENRSSYFLQQIRSKRDDTTNLSSLFVPVPVKPNPDDINVGAELTGTLNKSDLLKVISKFYQKKEIKSLLADNGLDRMKRLS